MDHANLRDLCGKGDFSSFTVFAENKSLPSKALLIGSL